MLNNVLFNQRKEVISGAYGFTIIPLIFIFRHKSICNLDNKLLESNSEEEILMFTENFEIVIIKF